MSKSSAIATLAGFGLLILLGVGLTFYLLGRAPEVAPTSHEDQVSGENRYNIDAQLDQLGP